jgi:hypothetical protein
MTVTFALSLVALLLLLLLLDLPSKASAQTAGWAHGGGACATDWDCSLGGVCDAGSKQCACDPYFTGPTCALLNLRRGAVSGTCGPDFDGYYSWGGKSVKNPADGSYHLVASFMCRHADLGQWTTVSSAAHLVSPNLTGPYVWAPSDCDGDICSPIEIPWSHNEVFVANQPAASAHPSFLVYHIGDGNAPPSDWSPCFNKSDLRPRSLSPPRVVAPEEEREVALARARAGPGGTAYVLTADSLATPAPWQRAFNNSGVFINFTSSWTTGLAGNPAPLIFPNGSAVLYFTAVPCPPNSGALAPNCIAAAFADSWEGPFDLQGASHPITYPESEDPFVFQDFRGNFHLLTNVNTCHARCASGVACGGHAWSRDGRAFSNLTVGAFGPLFTLADGTVMQNSYVERPLVHVADDGVTPLSFHVGVGRTSYLDSCNWVWEFCTDASDPDCGPTVPLPPAPPRRAMLRNGASCLVYNASGFPCSGAGPAAGCPVVMGNCSGAAGSVWQVSADGVPGVIVSDANPSLSLNVDCDSTAPHTLVKVLASGSVPLTVNETAGTIAYSGGMCFNTGEGPAVPPCGPKGEVWLETQIQLAACGDPTAQGWTVVEVP